MPRSRFDTLKDGQGIAMNQELLCSWLGLPKTAWPPDAWTLLGLPRDESDLSTIEECVHDRMKKLRGYQLSHPEEATEGMNRLAEAFITLTEACSKKPLEKPAPNGTAIAKDETSVIANTKLDWRNEPPPVRGEIASAPEVLLEDEADNADVLVAKPFAAPIAAHLRKPDTAHWRELAEESDEAMRNVGTIDAVILRVESTRRLLYAWEKVGRYLKANPKKTTAKECESFAKRLQGVADALRNYPAFLGQPGKPGYRVQVLAQFRMQLATVRGMPAEQRDELLFDWDAGYQVLLLHRKFLRRRLQSLRKRTVVGRFLMAVRSLLNDHPRLTLAGVVAGLLLIGAVMLALYGH